MHQTNREYHKQAPILFSNGFLKAYACGKIFLKVGTSVAAAVVVVGRGTF